MSYAANCPSCGAEVVFRLDRSILAICAHCDSAVARRGADLTSYGKVADLIPTPSVLRLGLDGRDPASGEPFTIVGRLQLDHGEGAWDEWYLSIGDRESAWLAEAQGLFHLMREVPMPPLPRVEQLEVGGACDLGPTGSFLVTEIKMAKFVAASGELPFDVEPGATLVYADLAGPRERLATIDYGDGRTAQAVYAGGQVQLDDLGFRRADLPTDEERRAKAAGGAVSCTQCGGPLEIRAPDRTKRIGCPWCGSLIDTTSERYEVLAAAQQAAFVPAIELGKKARFDDVEWTAIGAMERSVTYEGTRYPWREYLLYDQSEGFRWLIENQGHWSFVEPLAAGDFRSWRGATTKSGMPRSKLWHKGSRYKHFQSGTGVVDAVLGEFYWAVAAGDESEMHDYVDPPHLLSVEHSVDELHFSRGRYLEPAAVWSAFGLDGDPPEARGVGPNQPWPQAREAPLVTRSALAIVMLLVAVFIGFSLLRKEVVARTVSVPEVASGSPEAVTYTDPFAIGRRTNLRVRIRATLPDNSWLYVNGALLDEERGWALPFDIEASYYKGSGWKEDRRKRTRYLPGVRPGTYVLRLAPQWQQGRRPTAYQIEVVTGVPRFRYLLLAALLVGLWPIALAWRRMSFEQRRWSESDHPWGGG